MAHLVDDVCAQGHRREGAGGISRVDTGLLDMFHHSTDIQLLSVVQRVHIDFDGVVQEPIDKQRSIVTDDRKLVDALEIILQIVLVVDNLHRSTAQHEARPH